MFTYILIAIGVIVMWRIIAALRHNSAYEARFGSSLAPPTHTYDANPSHLPPHLNPHHPGWPYSVSSDGVHHDVPAASAGGAWEGGGGYGNSTAGGFDSSSVGGSDSGSSGGDSGGGGDFGGGGGGGSWS